MFMFTLVLLFFTTFGSFLAASASSNPKVKSFFEAFEFQSKGPLEEIELHMRGIDELVEVCPSVRAFPRMAQQSLAAEVSHYLHTDTNTIYDLYLSFYDTTVGLGLDHIKREQIFFENDLVVKFIEKYSSDLKDIILSCITKALDLVNTLPPSIPPLQSQLPVSHVKDDIYYEKLILLYYGISIDDVLFPCAHNYVEFIEEHGLNIYDPNQITFSPENFQWAQNANFDLTNPLFNEFRKVVQYSVPITSPFYFGKRTKSQVFEEGTRVLRNLAKDKMLKVIDNHDFGVVIMTMAAQYPSLDSEIIQFFFDHSKDSLVTFLLSSATAELTQKGIEASIKDSCARGFEMFGMETEVEFSESVSDYFLAILDVPLSLLETYDPSQVLKAERTESLSPLSISGLENIPDFNLDMGLFDAQIENQENRVPLFNRSATNRVPVVNRFAVDQIPDYPYENPSEMLDDPKALKDTCDYFIEHGDTPELNLEVRLALLKDLIDGFVQESFPESGDFLKEILEEKMDSVFKKNK